MRVVPQREMASIAEIAGINLVTVAKKHWELFLVGRAA